MRALARFAATVAAAALTAIALAPRLVWEGGKWIAKSVFPGQPQQQAMAEEELMAELSRPSEIPSADTGYDRPDEAWGRAAGDHLIPCGKPLHRPEAILDERARAYLDSLNVMERAAILAFEPRHIGQFLLGERKLPNLPPVPAAAQWNDGERARLAALAAPVKAGLAEMQARVDAAASIMREEGYEPVPALRPRAA